MSRAWLRIASPIVILLAFSDTACAQSSPVPSAQDRARSGCAATQADPYIRLTDVFAHDLSDAPTLRFIAKLATVAGKQQMTLFHSVAASSADVSDRVKKVVAQKCVANETAYRSRRALYTVINRWDFDTGDPAFPAFSDRLSAALAALELRDTLTPDDVDGALAPFDVRLADLQDITPTDAPPCEEPAVGARIKQIFQPVYPAIARSTRTTGSITLEVSLDRGGFVRSVTVLRANGDGPSIAALAEMGIFSAAETVYAPEIVHCNAVDGTYTFKAQFTNRR